MTQIKNFFYGGAMALLAFPVLVSAQFEVPKKTKLPEATSGITIVNLMTNFLLWLLAIVGVLAVLAFVISGILYLTSAGDEDQAEKAKKTMIYAIIGVIVALVGLIVVNAIEGFLRGSTTF